MGVAIPQIITEDRAGGGQVIEGSLRFDKTKTQYLRRTISTPTSANTWTFSCWIKRNSITYSEYQYIFSYDSTASRGLAITASIDGNPDCFYIYDGANLNVGTARKVRDASAWYHLVLRCSSGTATLYLNGESSPYITAAATMPNMSNGQTMGIGLLVNTSILPLDAQLSNLYFIDGQALDPSYFGYTDALTNTWRPKKLSSSVAFGTNGFYLPFDGSAPIGQDQSGRGNNWTPVNFGGSNTLEKATGALPILNTDGGGKVARVGVRTDSSASSLVLALPLVGIKSDFSNAINSGTSNKTVTNNGTITFSNSYSNFYGGSAYVSDASTQSFSFGNYGTDFQFTGDYTIECWVYPTTSSATDGSLFVMQSGSAYFAFNFDPVTQFNIYNNSGSASWSPSVSVATGQWNHLALVRSGSTQQIFVNGVSIGTNTASGTHGYASADFARIGGGASGAINSYIQDFRIYKGLAKYTQNFIPASTDPDILPDTPSGVSYSSNVALVPSTDGAVAFDGSGDRLDVSASSDFSFGTGDFTVEGWILSSDYGTTYRRIFMTDGPTENANGNFQIIINVSDGALYLWSNTGDLDLITTGIVANGNWNHFAACRSGSTLRAFVNGIQVGSTTYSTSISPNSGTPRPRIGSYSSSSSGNTLNGFISNLHVVKGTALYTSNFTPPSAPISSVANTKLLCCKSQSSATAADVTPGTITANGNAAATNFNPFTVNINTQRGQESGYCTWNPLDTAGSTLSNGNLNITTPSSGLGATRGTIGVSSGKWYYEHTITSGATAIGIMKLTDALVSGSGIIGASAGGYSYYSEGVAGGGYTKKINNGTQTDYGASFDPSDTISVAFDLDAGTITFYKNGVSQGVAFSGLSGTFSAAISDGTNAGSIVGASNFGQKPFKFPPPAGFQPLALANTPRPSIVRPDQYVGVTTYTGNGGTQSINVGFKPDFVWIKCRVGIRNHVLSDTVRGANNVLASNTTSAQVSPAVNGQISAFNSNGFTVASGSSDALETNNTNDTYVAWAWKAGGNSNNFNINDIGYADASAAGLTAGTITPTGASVNTKSGFSIITWTGNGSTSATVPHGLNNVPAMVILKGRDDSTYQWPVWHSYYGTSTTNKLVLSRNDSTIAGDTNGYVTSLTSTTFGFGGGTAAVNANTQRYVAYLWAEIPGFSKFGSFTGNNSTDGVYVSLGFRPKFLLVKCTQDITGDVEQWIIRDSTRSSYNPANANLYANLSNAEDDASGYSGGLDLLSNGFKMRGTYGGINASATYIYAAWAESPSVNLYGAQANAR